MHMKLLVFTFEKVGIQELDWSSWHYKENFYKGDKIKGKPYDGAKILLHQK